MSLQTDDEEDIFVEGLLMPDYITREDEPLMVEADAVGASPVNRGVDNGNEDDRRFREMSGAAVAGGIAGLLIAGPIVGLVAAGGAAVLATTQGRAGDVARATGNVAASAGDRVKRINEKHHIVERTGTGLKKLGRLCRNWIRNIKSPRQLPRASLRDAIGYLTS